MTSIGVCWINDCYYHQMNSNMNNKHLNVAIQDSIQQDSEGLYCPPNLKDEENYSPDSNILKLFNSPATARVLNYTENKILQQVVGADNDVHDDTFPVGYSQDSFIPDDFLHNEIHFTDPELSLKDYLLKQFRKLLKQLPALIMYN